MDIAFARPQSSVRFCSRPSAVRALPILVSSRPITRCPSRNALVLHRAPFVPSLINPPLQFRCSTIPWVAVPLAQPRTYKEWCVLSATISFRRSHFLLHHPLGAHACPRAILFAVRLSLLAFPLIIPESPSLPLIHPCDNALTFRPYPWQARRPHGISFVVRLPPLMLPLNIARPSSLCHS